PTWFRRVYAEVSQENLGVSYNSLLTLFTQVERGYKWEKGGKGLATLHRPPQVGAWVTAGRGARGGAMRNGVGPAILDLAVFEEQWWQWWSGLQPMWRVAAKGNTGNGKATSLRFSRDLYPAAGSDAWQSLRHPGPNGALSLVGTLYWWGVKLQKEGVPREDRDVWLEAVTDVDWMLRGLLAAEKRSV
ncbi:hypothetical protein DFH07DRAFT_762058, partial [Mycena maculata]